jgi:hypothetical protein
MANRGEQASYTKTQKSGDFHHQVSSKAQKHTAVWHRGPMFWSMAPRSDVLEHPLLMDA